MIFYECFFHQQQTLFIWVGKELKTLSCSDALPGQTVIGE